MGWSVFSRSRVAGMSSFAWPAARSISGTAAMFLAPLLASRFTHSEIGGHESSIKPPSTVSDGFLPRTRPTRSWNSRTPRGSRLPWPTIRSAGPCSCLSDPFLFNMLPLASRRFLLVVDQSVQCRRRDRGTAFRPRSSRPTGRCPLTPLWTRQHRRSRREVRPRAWERR